MADGTNSFSGGGNRCSAIVRSNTTYSLANKITNSADIKNSGEREAVQRRLARRIFVYFVENVALRQRVARLNRSARDKIDRRERNTVPVVMPASLHLLHLGESSDIYPLSEWIAQFIACKREQFTTLGWNVPMITIIIVAFGRDSLRINFYSSIPFVGAFQLIAIQFYGQSHLRSVPRLHCTH